MKARLLQIYLTNMTNTQRNLPLVINTHEERMALEAAKRLVDKLVNGQPNEDI